MMGTVTLFITFTLRQLKNLAPYLIKNVLVNFIFITSSQAYHKNDIFSVFLIITNLIVNVMKIVGLVIIKEYF